MTQNPRPKAYSYIRFSTAEQEKGDSLRRQLAAAELYAKINGLDLDTELTFRDLGVSAFQGANAETGRLGDFLKAIEHRDINAGSYLLVESLDRISRNKPRKAVKLLERICEAGVTVVTLNDQRVYTEASLDEDPTSLIVAILVAQRANEESATKARRLKQAWEGKRLKAATTPMTASCPAWLRLNDQRTAYEVIPERADVVRSVFRMYLDGIGQHAIAAKLMEAGTPSFGGAHVWHRTYIKKILENPAVIGRFTPHTMAVIDGRSVRTPHDPIEGYFPAVVDDVSFEKVASMTSGRGMRATAGTRPATASILAGLAKCPRCDATMTRINKGSGNRPYLVCTKAKVGAGCQYHQVRLGQIEDAVISLGTYLHDETPSPNIEYEIRYRELRLLDDEIGFQIGNLVDDIVLGNTSPAIRARIAELEIQRDEIRKESDEAGKLAADALTNRLMNTVDEFCALTEHGRDGVDMAKVNAILRQLFVKVVPDYDTGRLELHWRHAEGSPVEVRYTFPAENA